MQHNFFKKKSSNNLKVPAWFSICGILLTSFFWKTGFRPMIEMSKNYLRNSSGRKNLKGDYNMKIFVLMFAFSLLKHQVWTLFSPALTADYL